MLNDVCPIDKRGATQAGGRELIGRQQSRYAVIISWTKVVGNRRQPKEEIAGFNVELQVPLGVCWG